MWIIGSISLRGARSFEHLARILLKLDGKQWVSNAAVFYDPVRDARGMVHGDDFLLLADRASLDEVDGILKSRYECKCLGYLGFEEDDKR